MKNCFLFVLILFSIKTFGQTIPYATQQPKWVFPVYAKDATGKRDTIYLGYHPDASDVCGDEIQFGEIWFPGENDFSLSTYFWIDPIDSVLKANIRDTLENKLYYDCGYPITLSNVVLPVTFYWDISLLRSDSLPFPDQDPLPRAQLNIGFNAEQVVNESGISCNTSYPIIVSDTIDTPFCNCYVKDSLHFIDLFGTTSPQTFVLTFEFTPWVGHRPDLGVDEENNMEFSLFPNPTSDFVRLKGNFKNDIYQVIIYDNLFRICKKEKMIVSDQELIDVRKLEPGIYFIRVFQEGSNQYFNVKMIKQ